MNIWTERLRQCFLEPNYEGNSYGIVNVYTNLVYAPVGIVKTWKNTVTVLSRATDQILFLSNCSSARSRRMRYEHVREHAKINRKTVVYVLTARQK